MSRYEKVIPTLTVGQVKELIAGMDDRAEFKLQNGQEDPVSVRTIVPALGNRGESLALVIPRL